jgi:hypothetical protein
MPTPKRETLVQAVLTRMRAINGAGSYNFNLASSVHEWRATPFTVEELPAIIVRDRRQETEQVLANKHQHQLTFEIECWHTTPANLRKLAADVVEAIQSDRRWSGLAYDTDPVDDAVDAKHDGAFKIACLLRFHVRYRTNSFDPYDG